MLIRYKDIKIWLWLWHFLGIFANWNTFRCLYLFTFSPWWILTFDPQKMIISVFFITNWWFYSEEIFYQAKINIQKYVAFIFVTIDWLGFSWTWTFQYFFFNCCDKCKILKAIVKIDKHPLFWLIFFLFKCSLFPILQIQTNNHSTFMHLRCICRWYFSWK